VVVERPRWNPYISPIMILLIDKCISFKTRNSNILAICDQIEIKLRCFKINFNGFKYEMFLIISNINNKKYLNNIIFINKNFNPKIFKVQLNSKSRRNGLIFYSFADTSKRKK
jgi:hypothetical protein